MSEYLTIDGDARSEYEIKRSLFIATAKGITDYADGAAFVKTVSKKYSDATHNCYAILCQNGEQKFFDDGEPSGTAGMPILQAIKNNGLTDVAVVVTRYFGGIKLGAGGLVSAYTKAAVNALAESKTVTKNESGVYLITLSYSEVDRAARLVENVSGKVLDVRYGEQVCLKAAVPIDSTKSFIDGANELFSGKCVPLLVETGYETY